jgi:hypothetical protein
MFESNRRMGRRALLAVVIALLALCGFGGQAFARIGKRAADARLGLDFSLTPSRVEPFTACSQKQSRAHARGKAEHRAPYQCQALIVPSAKARTQAQADALAGRGPKPAAMPQLEGSGMEGGFSPSDLRSAYKISETGGASQTVAIVDAFDDPNAESDLAVYRSHYGLPACTKASGCFRKANQHGEEADYPEGEPGWSVEISLDLDMVSAICPECKILLVEANNNSINSLNTAEERASLMGATEISNSWDGQEEPKEAEQDHYFDHPGVPTTVAAGDDGYEVTYPAASKYVISVGGTTLKKSEDARGWEESVWRGSGGGCSLYEEKPAWQTDPGCAKRTDNDTAAVADTRSPVSVYDSYETSGYPFESPTGWILLGGTSVATPLVAGIEAHAPSAVRAEGAEAFYRHSLFDVTSGSNAGYGACGYLCTGEEGYDGPTGWGTPDGPLEVPVAFQAITAPATTVAANGATLNGYVNPEGKETTYRFEYGETTSYGNHAPASNASAGSGSVWQAVSQSIGSLEVGTTYHYRLVATNSSGTVYGKDQTFTTPIWTIQSTPEPGNEGSAKMSSVSCASSSWCISVGWYEEPKSSNHVSAFEWNGKEWTLHALPAPSGTTESELNSVSCFSTTACTAVGTYRTSTARGAFAEHWNGSEWSVQTIAGIAGVGSQEELRSVSCPSSALCVAAVAGTSTPLVERLEWNGSAWSAQSQSPPPPGGEYDELHAISCPSATVCTAVGFESGLHSALVSFADRWNGTTWTLQTIPATAGAEIDELEAVSCPSTSTCTAVGGQRFERGEGTPGEWHPLAERWNEAEGTEWSAQSIPTVFGKELVYLASVSCQSATECLADGVSNGPLEEYEPLAEIWNGKEWSRQGVELPPLEFEPPSLSGVSCPSTTVCEAVGSKGTQNRSFDTIAEDLVLPPFPSVETNAASSVSEAGATLNGSVNANGTETTYQFEYGRTSAYGHLSAAKPVYGSGNVKVGAPVAGLQSNTEYHFRILASNGPDTVYGPDRTFTTGLVEQWYGCSKQAGGKYTNNECSTKGAPSEWEVVRRNQGEKTNIVAHGKPVVLSTDALGVSTKFECASEDVGGSIENGSGGAAGSGHIEIRYSSCTVKLGKSESSEGCSVSEVANYPSKIALVSVEGKAEAKLTPEKEKFASFTFAGSKCFYAGITYKLLGAAYAIVNNASSQLEFNAATSTELKLGGTEATQTTTATIELEGGGHIQSQPAPVSWYGCVKQAGGNYAGSGCVAEGSPSEWELVRRGEGEKTNIVAHGKPVVISSSVVGISMKLECASEDVGGSIENGSGGAAGSGHIEIRYSSCTVKFGKSESSEGCTISEVANYPSKIALTNIEGKAEALFTPEKEKFARFTFAGKKCIIEGSYNLTGADDALVNNASSQLEINEATSTELRLSGVKATQTTSATVELEGGGSIQAR